MLLLNMDNSTKRLDNDSVYESDMISTGLLLSCVSHR